MSLKNSGDTYIYEAVKKGIPEAANGNNPQKIEDLAIPENIAIGLDTQKPELLERRKAWNNKTHVEYALPTEIWRETIGRWKRYFEVKSKITSGEINEINDFITYNLNIRQFIQDILENTDDPDLIRHFYKSIHSITILDPTCGSGAFLFAALNILEPLYEACIERMEQFTSEAPRRYKFFHEVLAKVNSVEHPNLRYYIYKTIILNNLYGVDIMHEAVEIAKLRLFLKMVGAVDINVRKPNFGLEPLPDIDFNIRAGNTLVGFATEKEFKKAVESKEPLFAPGIIKDFEDEFRITATAFKRFQDAQLITDKGEDTHKKAKAELQKRLVNLNEKLNGYLASTYDIDKNKIPDENKFKRKYREWYSSHQPFHWFAEFYEIINGNGGFDVVIGNPPYVEYSKVKKLYSVKGYRTESCGNLYAFVMENNFLLLQENGKTGMIVPHSAVCTDRMEHVINLLNNTSFWISTYSIRPAKLFVGVDQRLGIYIASFLKDMHKYTSRYYNWQEEYRQLLFNRLTYENVDGVSFKNSIPKIGSLATLTIWQKLHTNKKLVENIYGSFIIYFHNAPRYWIRAMDFSPYFWNERDGEQISGHVKSLNLPTKFDASVVVAILNSSLFYWWFILLSNCRDLTMREVQNFPIEVEKLTDDINKKLAKLSKVLMNDLLKYAHRKECFYKATGKVVYDEFYPKHSKPIIDEIDKILAKHYGFTEEELDFIINYDIKYRMGKALFGENDTEAEDE